MVRCKVRCYYNETTKDGDTAQIRLEAVCDGSGENKEFFKYTPAASMDLGVVNPEAAKQFEQGKEYYVDFIPAE